MTGFGGAVIGTPGKFPLVVDLDGALFKSDLAHESALQLVRRNPGVLLRILYRLVRGRPAVREFIAKRVELDVEALPARDDFVAWAKREHAAGRPVVLLAGADKIWSR
jgi:hypothetical protein